MNSYFAYIRVSTTKQGQEGTSLQEQRAAIEAYASRLNMSIAEWFEDQETAAKKGRTQFSRMMSALERKKAAGVILHKIDRGARNLWDWARIQSLLDAGLEVHSVHDNLDMTSRGGRLAADIQAVVAADYVRNLRDEVRKGLRGRLKQGIYPFNAPIGYVNEGKAKAKTIDPVLGPLVRRSFELYASGRYTFRSLQAEMYQLGLKQRNGKPLNLCRITSILRNPFYTGVIHLKSTGERFSGIHEPLVSAMLFRQVQDVLDGRLAARPKTHDFLYRRLFKCALCGRTLIGERKKGRVYYRCHERDCITTGVTEGAISEHLSHLFASIQFSDEDIQEMHQLLKDEAKIGTQKLASQLRSAALRETAIQERLSKLTDAYLDQAIALEVYQAKQGSLLLELADARQRRAELQNKTARASAGIGAFFEFVRVLRFGDELTQATRFRQVLRELTSNRGLSGKSLCVTMQSPFRELVSDLAVLFCGPPRNKNRTFPLQRGSPPPTDLNAKRVRILVTHLAGWEPPLWMMLEHRETDVRAPRLPPEAGNLHV